MKPLIRSLAVAGVLVMKKAVAGLAAAAVLVGMSACAPPAKEVTPQVCIDALDHSGEIVSLVTEVIEVNSNVNYKRMGHDAAIEKLDDLQPKIQAASDAWVAAGDQCRAMR